MTNSFLWFGLVAFFSAVIAKSDYFPGVTRGIPQEDVIHDDNTSTSNEIKDVSEEDYRKLEEIAKFLQKRVEESEAAEEVSERESEVQRQPSQYDLNPPFQYSLPKVSVENDNFQPFAVGPFDPRYYQNFGHSAGVSETPSHGKEKRPNTDGSKETEKDEISSEVYGPSQSYVRQIPVTSVYAEDEKADIYFTAIVAGCSAAATVAVIAIGIGCYRLQKNAKAAADVDYPAYGVTGPNKDISPTSGDRRLAQSAQMYHYQHQKQQIIAMESVNNKERRSSISDAESEEENEEGDYTVYECPGLAPTGEMEVKNPLFQDDQTPASKTANNSVEESRELPK